MSLKTIAIVQVSEDFLNGREGSSCKFLLNDLNLLEFKVKKYVFISENMNLLAYELDVLTKQFDIVVVIGSLKSGVIFKGVAKATSQGCIENEKLTEIVEKLEGKYNEDEVMIPVSARLITSVDSIYPVIDINRIYILNIDYLEGLYFNILKGYLEQYGKSPLYCRSIYIQRNGRSKQAITQYVNENVDVKFDDTDTKLICKLSAASFVDLVNCECKLKQSLNTSFLESCDTSPLSESIYSRSKENVKQSLKDIEESISKYGIENIFLSFNGGKDCTVLLHLFMTVLKVKHPTYKQKISCLYVKSPNAFPEQDSFIAQCELYYNLEVITICSGIKEGLRDILALKPNLKACLMGTRRTDPYSRNLKVFQMTDAEWPQVMRVCPILDWHYSDVWDYLLFYKVPYCKLYDLGFTSLGNSVNTIRNPCLKYYDAELGQETYLPAFKMLNQMNERDGRNT